MDRYFLAALTGALAVFVGGAAGAGGGDPTFAPSGTIEGWIGAVADFNGGGKPDLAVVNDRKLTVLLGDGAGHFQPAPGPALGIGANPDALAVGDFNGDGRKDLAVAHDAAFYDNGGDCSESIPDLVTVFLGDGAGGFSRAPGSPIAMAGTPFGVIAADLNGDGKDDLVVPVCQGSQTANQAATEVLLGDGTGRFAQAPGSPIGGAALAVADVNGDQKPDLVMSGVGGKSISVLLGDGAGRFRAAPGSPMSVSARSIAIADLNGDGKPDLAVAEDKRVSILLGDGAGGFRAAPGSPLKVPRLSSVAVADFNGDGKPDLALADDIILLGRGDGSFRRAAGDPFAAGSGDGIVAALDLNGDGKPDLVTPSALSFQRSATPAIAPARALRGRPDAVFSTHGLITTLAADGQRVAAAQTHGACCGRIVVWTAPGHTSTAFNVDKYLESILCGNTCVDEVAVSADQVAWIAVTGGNSLELHLFVASLSSRQVKEIEYQGNGAGAGGDPTGGWMGQLLGGGPILAYNNWRTGCDLPANWSCGEPDRALFLTDESLVRIVAGHRVVLRRGASSYPLGAVGGGRMAVVSGGAVVVLKPSGSRVASVPASAVPPRGVALNRTHLAIQSPLTLDLYNPATGAKTKSLPLGPAAALELAGINAKLALLLGRHHVVLVRLGDGRLISLPLKGAIDPKLTEAGLFYAYNTPKAAMKGHIVFEPTATLLARF